MFCLLSFLLPQKCSIAVTSSRFLFVGGSGVGNYTSIQAAINDAEKGDTIYVFSGIYYEHLNINKSINLIGEKRGTTIIHGKKPENTLNIMADRINISDFTLRCDQKNMTLEYTGIFINSNFASISRCLIEDFPRGISLKNSSYSSIKDCLILNNVCGIWLYGSNNTSINNCTVFSIELEGMCRPGISLFYSHNNTIYNSNISSQKRSALHLLESSFNEIHGNTFYESQYGLYVYSMEKGKRNLIYENNFINNKEGNAYTWCNMCNTSWDNGYVGNYWDDYTGIDEDRDGIGDQPYSIPTLGPVENEDRYPLMEPVGPVPTTYVEINISSPANNSTVSGVILIQGNASSQKGDIKIVKVKVGYEDWRVAEGTTTWKIEWNVSKLKSGSYNLHVYAQDVKGYSASKKIKINVEAVQEEIEDKKEVEKEEKKEVPGFTFLYVLFILFLLVFIRRYRKK
jgi:parallel beta-helix repeat protein